MDLISIIGSQRRRTSGGGGGGGDADADALIAAMTTAPDSTREALIRSTIADLKTAGIWAKLDELWIRAAHTQQAALLGWKRLSDSSTVGTVVFTTDRGFNRTAANSYINTGWNPTMAVNFSQDSATLGFYSRTDALETSVDLGSRSGNSVQRLMLLTRIGGSFSARINEAGSTDVSNSDSLGWHAASRVSSSSERLFKNGSFLVAGTTTSESPNSLDLFELGNNQNEMPNLLSSRQGACSLVGAALTDSEHSELYDIIQSYMTSVGANV